MEASPHTMAGSSSPALSPCSSTNLHVPQRVQLMLTHTLSDEPLVPSLQHPRDGRMVHARRDDSSDHRHSAHGEEFLGVG